ncbi:nucleoside triphosphate pyrophosphatase [Actinokineospora auranticolor]|uniref:Nucleoside triphosphate pyrophosphatase n=1 Tax=Actinokineospora auranticolor TaxID=155976 RepID=A0A2S6GX25_9PSEU|nr:nucleoside triphosphate pyrophosphatase [Actinokineospora auranticolor]PPK69769.1 septum formation protein [Actinokineospora auranticolor]
MRFVLASQSPARLGVLKAAGIEPVVRVSGVDEDAVIAGLPNASPEQVVTALAEAKARTVVGDLERVEDAVVVGCDSMLRFDGQLVGKPGTPEVAKARWLKMAGGEGTLLTGHAVLRVRHGVIADSAIAAEKTVVRFASPTVAEIDAYIATGEPLQVAGAFTLDSLGGWFVDGIDGDPSSVIGISLPLTRRLLSAIGVSVTDLWRSTK